MKSSALITCLVLVSAVSVGARRRRHSNGKDVKGWDYLVAPEVPKKQIYPNTNKQTSDSKQTSQSHAESLDSQNVGSQVVNTILSTVLSKPTYYSPQSKDTVIYNGTPKVRSQSEKLTTQSSPSVYPESLLHLIPAAENGQVQYKVVKHEGYDELQVLRRCVWKACGMGRQCVKSERGEEMCICAEKDVCVPGHSKVCGSDANFYNSHCALHREACVTGKKIYVDHKAEACLQREMLEKEAAYSNSFKSSEAQHVESKKKDLSQMVKSPPPTEKPTEEVTSTESSIKMTKQCMMEQFEEFKHLLRIYHCNRLGISKCDSLGVDAKRALVSDMFDYYDGDQDGLISLKELSFSQTADHIESMVHICKLQDFITYGSMNQGTQYLDLIAFYDEFGVEISELQEDEEAEVRFDGKMKVTYVTANGYQGVELICGLKDQTPWIMWQRNGQDIDLANTNAISLITNTKLYISVVSLDHTGNYTCYDSNRPQDTETQLLFVQVKPVVRSNRVGDVLEGLTTDLRCHTDGVPQPSAHWQVSQYDLPTAEKDRYSTDNENSTVTILSPSAKVDSAKYQCVAKSPSGWSVAETEVKVLTKDDYMKEAEIPGRGLYLVFHGEGYTTYEADHCYTTHSIDKHAADFVMHMKDPTNTLDRLCPYNDPCDWGSVANVRNKLVYVSQPSLNRIVVIDPHDNFRPKHVILLKHSVTSLHYHENNDQLWILVGNQPQFQTVMILDEASHIGSVTLKPLLPEHNVFDAVDGLFIPEETSFNTSSRYAYTSHYKQHGLSRLDTVTMGFHGSLDLSKWQCQKTSLHHMAIGGLALVECEIDTRPVSNLLLDMVTNQVISEMKAGRVYVSPNSRYIVRVAGPKQLTVYYLHDNATIAELYTHNTQIVISQVKFMQSKHSIGYDLAITSLDENSILFVDLKTKRTELLQGLLSGRTNFSPSHAPNQAIATSGEFGEHLIVPSQGAVFIVNKQYHMIACEWTNVKQHQLSAWIQL